MDLHTYRRTANLTLEKLAERIGCSVTTVHDLERGKRRPSLAMVERILSATDGAVQPQDFLSGAPDPDTRRAA